MTPSRDDMNWGDGLVVTGYPEMPGAPLGADLRTARERLGWTLDAVAGYLRIRRAYLQAIEEGRTQELPGPTYALGFVRAYAQALGLDPNDAARRLRAETGEAPRRPELDFPTPVPERGVPALVVILVGAVVAIGAYVAWFRMSGNDRPSTEVVQQLPEHLTPLVPETPPPAAKTAPIPSGSAQSFASGTVQPAAQASASVPPSAAAAATTQPAPVLPAVDGPRIVVRATADAWIQVRDKQGPVLFNRMLRAGETWQVPAKSSLLLTTGNAGATELVVDGVVTPSLGGDGAVRRDLPLDADAIKGGKLAANAGATPGQRPAVLPHNE